MFNSWIYYIVLGSSILPIITFIIKFLKYKFDNFGKVFILLIFLCFFSDIGVLLTDEFLGNVNPIFHFSIIPQFIFIVFLFSFALKIKFIKWILIFLGGVMFISDLTLTSNLFKINYNSIIFSYSVIVFLGWVLLYSNTIGDYKRNVLIPITIYYTTLLVHSFFEKKIDSSKFIFDSTFLIISVR